MKALKIQFVAWLLFPSLCLASRSGGLFITALEGPAHYGLENKAPAAAALGKVMNKGMVLELEAGSKVRLLAAERIPLGLVGPATLKVEKARHIRLKGGVRLWQIELSLKQGCLWLDSRYQFMKPLDFILNLPSGPLKVGSQCRWMIEVPASGPEKLAEMGPDGQALAAARGKDKDLILLTPTASPTPAATSSKETEAGEVVQSGPCDDLLKWAKEKLPVLILCDDYDLTLKHRPRARALGPALLGGFMALSGAALVDQSASTLLARRAAPALKGMDSLARRVGRELGARWVLVANASVKDAKQKVKMGRKKSRTLLTVRGQAEARIIDVVTGDLLATDAVNTRVAVGKMGRDVVAREAFLAVSRRLAGYMAEHAGLLLQGEPHPAGLLSLTLNNVDNQRAGQVERALGSLESVQRVFRRKFQKKLLKMDVLLRVPQARFEEDLAKLKFEGFSLKREKESISGGLALTLRENEP